MMWGQRYSRLKGQSQSGSGVTRVRFFHLSLSQEELAANSRISLSTVQKLDTGKENISLNNLLTILRLLGLIENIDQLIPEQPENPYRNFRY